MSAADDRKFRDAFSLTIGLLAGAVIGIYFLAVFVADRGPPKTPLDEPEYQRLVAARLEYAAKVAIAGQDNSALAITASASTNPTAQASSSATVAKPTTGPEVYNQVCVACHGQGIAGAPRTGDATAWDPRIAKGKTQLYQHSIQGFQGTTGVMPPKGGRTDLPDDLVRAAVDHMLGMIRGG